MVAVGNCRMVHLLPFSWPRLLPHGVSMAFRTCRHLSARLQNPPCAFTFARPFFHVPGHACCLSSCSFHPSRFPGHVSCQMVFLWRFGTAGLLHDASLAFRDCQIASFSRVSPHPSALYPLPHPILLPKWFSMPFRNWRVAPFSTASKTPLRFYPRRARFCGRPAAALTTLLSQFRCICGSWSFVRAQTNELWERLRQLVKHWWLSFDL